MGIFRKNEEVLDLTLLQKKGILKIKEEKDEVELTKSQANSNIASHSSSPFEFLDNLAQTSQADNKNYFQSSTTANSADLQDLRVKFEDIEYKMQRLIERFEKIEEKIREFER